MIKAVATQIHEAALAAGWSATTARWLPFHASNLATAQQIIASAKNLPETIRAMLMQNARSQSSEQVLAAFRDAAEIAAYSRLEFSAGLPDTFRDMRAFIKDGERLMTVTEAREKIIRELAAMDVHIDTSRPVDSAPLNVGSFKALADAVWARAKANGGNK